MIADSSFRTYRDYARMAERELADEADLRAEQAELNERPDGQRDLRVERAVERERLAHLKRAEIYARLSLAVAQDA